MYSSRDVMRAPADASGPKVIKPRMSLGFPVCMKRGMVAVGEQ